jgi:hypothetical protein
MEFAIVVQFVESFHFAANLVCCIALATRVVLRRSLPLRSQLADENN